MKWSDILLVLVGFLPSLGLGATTYGVVDLTALYSLPQENYHFAQPMDLNDRGDILLREITYNQLTGFPDVVSLTVRHADSSLTVLPSPYSGGFVSEVALNNRGEVAVTVFPDKSHINLATRELWVYSSTGVPSKVEGFIGGLGMENLSFNDAGQIAVSNTAEDRAYRYTPGLGWEDLGSLSADGFAVPRALNNAGAVVGGTSVGTSNVITPFLARAGQAMEDIPAPFGLGRAINDHFVVTGDGGWVWHADEMRMEYIFNNQAYGFIRPRDINDAGAIIGVADGSGITSGTAFLWDAQNGYQILSNILEDPLSWTVTDAYAINDDGWILASGYEGRGLPTAASHYAWLLLRPVPEPGTALLMAAGAALFLRRRQ